MSPQTVPDGRRVSDSATEMTQLVLPQHANVHGTVLGGTVMHWVDLAAAIVANRHSRRPGGDRGVRRDGVPGARSRSGSWR